MKSTKVLTIAMIATAALMAIVGIMSNSIQTVSAQSMTGMGDSGNMTSNKDENTMINGTINLHQTIFEAIGSKVNTSLAQAITTAEQSVGNNSFALAALVGPHNDFLVYTVILGTPGMEFQKVIVDPGSGEVLDSKVMSHEELMKLEQAHMGHSGMGSPGGAGMMMEDDLESEEEFE